MEEGKILFEIKALERSIARSLIHDCDLKMEELNLRPTPTQMQIIEYILNCKEKEVYQKDLEEILDTRRATVSGVLQTMERNGLIERITDTGDSRVKKIILCEKSKRIFLHNKQKLDEIEKIILKDVPKEDIQIFTKVIKKMKNNIENADKADKEEKNKNV